MVDAARGATVGASAVIQLIRYPMQRGHKRGRHNPRVYVDHVGFAARRRGCLLVQASGNGVRVWVSEERARMALARDYPGEPVCLEGERKSA
jgi:hypothetical protein